ncbi:MAG TPA: methyltransferase domain-containing protein [Sphingomicrobium sp.]|nr:methyltransferase domain-containing protein [Sphingomicrobium sp.]
MSSERFRFVTRNCCPACGDERIERLYECGFAAEPLASYLCEYYKIDPSILADGAYVIAQCRGCRSYFQAEVGDEALLRTLYCEWIPDPAAGEYALTTRDMESPARSRDGHELMVAAAFLGMRLEDMRTFDYGMGFAGWAPIARKLGCQSFGTDLSPSAVEAARCRGVEIVSGDRIPEGWFHFINTEQVLEHVPQPRELVGKLARALVPGGVLKISVPAPHGLKSLVSRLKAGASQLRQEEIVPLQPLEHVNCFTQRSIDRLGRDFGLARVRPTLRQSYAFLSVRGALGLDRIGWTIKELVRPWYQYHNPRNLYAWLRKPAAADG